MTSRPTILYFALIVAAISVTIFSLAGIAAFTGHLPGAAATSGTSAVAPAPAPAPLPATMAPYPGGASAPQAPTWRTSPRVGPTRLATSPHPADATAPVPAVPPAAPFCPSCGVVQSIREVQTQPAASGVGAVAGGVVGALLGNQVGGGGGRTAMTVLGAGGGALVGNEIEKQTKRGYTYEVRVRLDDGEIRVLHQHERPPFFAGDRVRIVDGAAVLAG